MAGRDSVAVLTGAVVGELGAAEDVIALDASQDGSWAECARNTVGSTAAVTSARGSSLKRAEEEVSHVEGGKRVEDQELARLERNAQRLDTAYRRARGRRRERKWYAG